MLFRSSIPENKTILIPALNCASPTGGCMNELSALQYKVLLDGTEQLPLMQEATIVHGDAVADNPFTAQNDAHAIDIVAEGAWVRLQPLSGGEHTLVINITGAYTYAVTYTLTVAGAPAATTTGTPATTTTGSSTSSSKAPAASGG